MSKTARIICGTYARVLYGVDAHLDDDSVKFEPVWLFEGHTASVRALASGSRYLATGSSDESIKLYDLKKRKELGSLIIPDSNSLSSGVTSLVFTSTHLVSTHESGTMIIWRIRNWTAVATVRANPKNPTKKECINDCAVHKSEKFALTVGRDSKLRLWNLVRGRTENVEPLHGSGEPLGIHFSDDGETFIVHFDRGFSIHSIAGDILYTSKQARSKIHCVQCLQKYFLYGEESGSVVCVDAKSGQEKCKIKCNPSRIKAINTCHGYAFAASTDGTITCLKLVDGSAGAELSIVDRHKIPGEDLRVTSMICTDAAVEKYSEVVKRRKLMDANDSTIDGASDSEVEGSVTSENGDQTDLATNNVARPESAPQAAVEASRKATTNSTSTRKRKKPRK